jgi:hypothetical protein
LQDQVALDFGIQDLSLMRGVSESRKVQLLTDQDNRREQRFSLELPVYFGRVEGGQSLSGISENISVHGLSLKTEAYVAAGTELHLSIVLPSVARPFRLTAVATVVRTVRLDRKSYGIAVSCQKGGFALAKLDLISKTQ